MICTGITMLSKTFITLTNGLCFGIGYEGTRWIEVTSKLER